VVDNGIGGGGGGFIAVIGGEGLRGVLLLGVAFLVVHGV